RVAVISLVTEQLGDAVEQTDICRPDCAVGGVARREDQDPRAAQLIDKAVNLAVAPALGDANRLFRRPPFPPPAQRCALTCVLSRAIRSGGSAGSAAASKMLCQIPCALQRLKRLQTVLAGPYSGGQSTHRHPLLSTCMIPLKMRRLFFGFTPRRLLGINGSILAHCPSLNQNKFARICWPPDSVTNPLNLNMVNWVLTLSSEARKPQKIATRMKACQRGPCVCAASMIARNSALVGIVGRGLSRSLF